MAEQVEQLARLSRLKRFLAPQLAELIVSGDARDPLVSHRREVTVVFLDLRGFTSFAETAEPEEVMAVLRDYHAAMGRLIQVHEGTLERFTGDGLMIFFNDPVEVENPAERAVRMALAMREAADALGLHWRRRGIELGLGIGIAEGYATIGAIGFEDRVDYGAIGTVTNLAARLCAEAKAGQILLAPRVLCDVERFVRCRTGGRAGAKGICQTADGIGSRRLAPRRALTGLSLALGAAATVADPRRAHHRPRRRPGWSPAACGRVPEKKEPNARMLSDHERVYDDH